MYKIKSKSFIRHHTEATYCKCAQMFGVSALC